VDFGALPSAYVDFSRFNFQVPMMGSGASAADPTDVNANASIAPIASD
jgi:hypothetical protein